MAQVKGGSTVMPVKYFKMGEIMEATRLSRQTIHNYTVSGLISEVKRTPKGHRLYGEDVFERLEKIKILQEKNYTLSQIKKIFEKKQTS